MKVVKEQIEQLRKRFIDSNFGDVLVVGGGISGIQAALDLGTAGFKVYLVDKAPSIGGHMAQLDKTFPTNDCSM
jgi:heterodisulfide reductase subunit A